MLTKLCPVTKMLAKHKHDIKKLSKKSSLGPPNGVVTAGSWVSQFVYMRIDLNTFSYGHNALCFGPGPLCEKNNV